ncbi:uncharacterized protein LOC121858080 [Homarus americanus]|uniref:uncharacterized protein LOC121858080 n=1 Tax=Homarus americanus TaxID=6706 RepID=UPI001C45E139|nr:uncharacterized protein LOC121858080 [Homarus americanus]
MAGEALRCVVLLALCCAGTYQARIGDERVSLHTGRPINASVTQGSCTLDGLTYPSETAIPRDHPCHYCICYQSQVTCYWKQCAAAPRNCAIMHFENVCNPSLYMCKIPEKARPEPKRRYGDRINSLRRRRLIREATPTSSSLRLPVDEPFPAKFDEAFVARVERSVRMRRALDGSSAHHHHHHHDKSCTILGVKYNLGEVIGVASDVCMECRCAAGKMFCSPRCCFLPSPFQLSLNHQEALTSRQPGPARPHPLSYVRNQYEEDQVLSWL